VAARADRVIDRVLSEATERALVFSHGHFLRALAARWIGEEVAFGRRLVLATGTLSVLGWERDTRAITRWNAPTARADTGAPAGGLASGPAIGSAGVAETPESGSGVDPPRP
jgi:broad specificity phosphatase PhoE